MRDSDRERVCEGARERERVSDIVNEEMETMFSYVAISLIA